MIFGEVPIDQAEGAILAHSERAAGQLFRKGMRLTAADVALLAQDHARLVVARAEAGDIHEDAAASRLADALLDFGAAEGLARSPAFTGRVNLAATGPGLIALDVPAIHRLNAVDPAITLATLPPFARVSAGTLVATVKIIAYAVLEAALAAACAQARAAIRLCPVQRGSAGLILTEGPGQDRKLLAKGRRAVEARLQALGMQLAEVRVLPHDSRAIAAALPDLAGDLALILTASATSDLQDTAPAALRLAGGTVHRFGMPVDPGNLLFHGDLAGRPVIGLPGCVRSPALNGADFVLERYACGLAVSDAYIAAMGVGGLLKETPSRPHPRQAGPQD